MVLGDHSCSRCCGFETVYWMDMTFLYCFFKKTENKGKRGQSWPFKKPNYLLLGLSRFKPCLRPVAVVRQYVGYLHVVGRGEGP